MTRERLTAPEWHVEITVMEEPFPFAMRAHKNNSEAAFRQVEHMAKRCGLTPVGRLEARKVDP